VTIVNELHESPDVVRLVGVLNVTPDSFSDGGTYVRPELAVEHGRTLVDQGAWAIDVGGESTRPGAAPVTSDEELERVLPVVAQLAAAGVRVSIDTRHAEVAEHAIRAGAQLINDVAGLRDAAMIEVAATHAVPVIVMHSPAADPAQAHRHAGYHDVAAEVTAFLAAQAAMAIAAGVPGVIVDPGLGFGKSTNDNLQLIARIDALTSLGYPVLVGASRKRFVGVISGVSRPSDRDVATVAVHLAAVERGAQLLRVHNVAAHAHALQARAAVNAAARSPNAAVPRSRRSPRRSR
jgi:dihydropteroate synthase